MTNIKAEIHIDCNRIYFWNTDLITEVHIN